MGMFDDVLCEAELPDGFKGTRAFQTKDFHCELAKYRITADGLLEVERYDTVEDGVYGDDDPLTFRRGLAKWRRENERWERVEYHGTFRFYTYDDHHLPPLAPHDDSLWHEYEAKFTDGRLVEIKQLSPVVADG